MTLTPTKMAPFLRYCADRRLRTYAWNKWVTIAGWASDSMTFCNGTRIDGIVNQRLFMEKIQKNKRGLFKPGGRNLPPPNIISLIKKFFENFQLFLLGSPLG